MNCMEFERDGVHRTAVESCHSRSAALSPPEMVILRKVLRPQLLAVFIAVMTAGSIGVGCLFNALMS
jgi:hypothetical protein